MIANKIILKNVQIPNTHTHTLGLP